MSSRTVAAIVGSAFIGLAFSCFAQTAGHSQTRPLDQAIESVDANLQKDPDNPGLNRAAGQLRYNQERMEFGRPDDRPLRPERPERAHRPDLPQRPMR